MVDCVVPVSTDNPLAYNLVLVSLYLVAKKTSGETAKLVLGSTCNAVRTNLSGTLQCGKEATAPWGRD